jgi:hypothetical protein
MSNVLMPSGKEGFATAAINWPADDIRVVLLTAGYIFSLAHDFLDDIGAGFRVATSAALAGKTATGGVLTATNYLFVALAGAQVTQGYYYRHTGVEATSRLIVYFDQGIFLPFTPNGGNKLMEHGNGTGIIASL